LAHSPSAPSVRQANNFMFLSVVDTPTWRSKKCFFFFSFFLSFVYCSTAGYTTYKCDEEPCNEVKSFPEGDNNKSCPFRSLVPEPKNKKKT